MPLIVLTLLFTVIILVLEIFLSYQVYSGILKWLALALLSYPITYLSSTRIGERYSKPAFSDAGFLAKLIFSVGIIGLGLPAVPVLSGSAAYAVSEAFNWKASLKLKPKRAHGFYGVITIGLMINFIGTDPVKALVYSSMLNGVAAVPLLFLVVRSPPIRRSWANLKAVAVTGLIMGHLFCHGRRRYRDVFCHLLSAMNYIKSPEPHLPLPRCPRNRYSGFLRSP